MMRRLWSYCEDMFDLGHNLQNLRGEGFSKRYNASLLASILLSGAFLRLPSLNAFELSLISNKAWRKLFPGAKMPSADTLGRGLEKFEASGLRGMLRGTNHVLRRGKAFNTRDASAGLMVAAIDGHETFSSERRCCDLCLTRKKTPPTARSSNIFTAMFFAN